MWAKPQIDILVLVNNLKEVNQLIPKLESKGYAFQKYFNKSHERYFARDASYGERLTSIHILQKRDPKIQQHLYFRDYLKEPPQERKEYSHIKKMAYEAGVNRAEYPKRKKEILERILKRTKKWSRKKIYL